MKLKLKEPIVIGEGENKKVYEYAALNLASSTGYSNLDQYTLALRLTPYRMLEDGTMEKLEDHTITHSYLDALSSPLAPAAEAILNIIQQTINK